MTGVISVSELNSYLKQYLEQNSNLFNLSIKGEISNLVYHTTGHIYFTIKDAYSQIKAIMFSSYAKKMKLKLKEGNQVVAIGSIKVYEPQGQYTLQVTDISFDGVGELYIKYEQLKQELEQKGWFASSLKKPLSKFPKNIGIITASTGAAIRDIITTIKRRYPLVNIYLFPCLVQGKEAKYDIAKKIEIANEFEVKLDCLIVGRGGGSIEDLWAFNEIEVVKAIFQSHIPIISAVGHEIDFTLADFVSDVRAPTPTAAAELATPDWRELKLFLNQEYRNLIKIIKQYVLAYQEQFTKLKKFYLWSKPNLLYQPLEQNLRTLTHKFINLQQSFFYLYSEKIWTIKRQLIKNLENQIQQKIEWEKRLILTLDLLSPLKTLARGYSITLHNNKVLTSIKKVTIETEIITKIMDGQFKAKVIEIEEKKDEQ